MIKEEIYCANSAELRKWLDKNHQRQEGIWLVFNKGKHRTMDWTDIVEELLCFGWIDSKAGTVDETKARLWISPRKPKSNWSAKNKLHIAELIKQGRMMPAGIKMVELAKQTGTWNALDSVDNLEIPADFGLELKKYPNAYTNFNNFPKSAKRMILFWIFSAKTEVTRNKRIAQSAALAEQNIRANQ